MDSRAEELIKQSDKLFEQRPRLVNFWQEVAEQFYPERADFTVTKQIGDQYADNLMTSYPVLVRRDLGNSISSLLRPTQKEWFSMRAAREEREDQPARLWLEQMTGRLKRAMYDPAAMFTRAMKEGDHDYAAFGQTVISVELNRARTNLLYRCHHLRDVVWCENAEGKIDRVDRKWKARADHLVKLFGKKVHPEVLRCCTSGNDPFQEFDIRHIVLTWDNYPGMTGRQTPWVSVYVDVKNQHVIEQVGVWNKIYCVPRWQTVSGSQYAYSPAVTVGLPDARLLQAMTSTLLEAGEMAVRPPMIAKADVIRGDLGLYSAGLTIIDADYDEQLGEALRPIKQDFSGIPIGVDMQRDIRAMLSEAFYINKLTLPPPGKDMTAYEIGQRIQEYIRQALPLFEPMEVDYNGQIVEESFDICLRNGVFGTRDEIPDSLQGADIRFQFESPLHEAIERQKGSKMAEVRDILLTSEQIKQLNEPNVNSDMMLRDVLKGVHAPANWLNSEEDVAKEQQRRAQQAQGEAMMARAAQVAQIAEPAANASKAMAEAEAARRAA